MPNGYSVGRIFDETNGSSSVSARVQYFKTGTLMRTLNLTKSAGAAFWSYSTAIAPATYSVTATDITALLSQTQPITVLSGQIVEKDFDNLLPMGAAASAAQQASAKSSGKKGKTAESVWNDFQKAMKKLKEDHGAEFKHIQAPILELGPADPFAAPRTSARKKK